MELGRKFEFFPIFYYKTILFSSESEFSMKNVIWFGLVWLIGRLHMNEGKWVSQLRDLASRPRVGV